MKSSANTTIKIFLLLLRKRFTYLLDAFIESNARIELTTDNQPTAFKSSLSPLVCHAILKRIEAVASTRQMRSGTRLWGA